MNKFRPEVHKFLKKQGNAISAQIRKRLEHMGKAQNPDEPAPPPSAAGGAVEVTAEAQAATEAQQILSNYQVPSWTSDATQLLQDFLVQIYTDAGKTAAAQVGVGIDEIPTFHVQADMYTKERTAQLVTQLDQSTRQMLQTTLRNDMADGKTPKEIERDLNKNYAFSDARAETIARTETAFAWNHSIVKTYESGGAKAVTVYDGDYDADCEAANGEVWTFEYAIAHRLQHPRCVRSFGPEMEGKKPDRGLTGQGFNPMDAIAAADQGGEA